MSDFFVELVEHHNSQMSDTKSRCFLAGAAQARPPRLLAGQARGNPRRTTLSGKRAISGWKLASYCGDQGWQASGIR